MVITFGVLKTPFASDIGGDRYFNAEMVMWIMMCQHSLISLVSRVSSCPNSQPEGFSSGGGGGTGGKKGFSKSDKTLGRAV